MGLHRGTENAQISQAMYRRKVEGKKSQQQVLVGYDDDDVADDDNDDDGDDDYGGVMMHSSVIHSFVSTILCYLTRTKTQ